MNIEDLTVVALDEEKNELIILDQTKLPAVTEYLHLSKIEDIYDAIYRLKVRGAPAIGVAAAFGIYVVSCNIYSEAPKMEFSEFRSNFLRAKDYLNASRPTAVNLSWALSKMEERLEKCRNLPVSDVITKLKEESLLIQKLDIDTNMAIGEHMLSLLGKGDGILTHCNAGHLATSRYGTATSAIYLGQKRGYDFKVYCDETRPLLQGARLTAWELVKAGIDTTLICDNMAPTLMKKGFIKAVIVGCDRVALNGDVANKIGTSYVSLAAKHFGIPFYVCAPSSTVDLDCPTGNDIVIEERPAEEITDMWYEKRMAPEGVKIINPAFDITDAEMITAIITEKGICMNPSSGNIKDYV